MGTHAGSTCRASQPCYRPRIRVHEYGTRTRARDWVRVQSSGCDGDFTDGSKFEGFLQHASHKCTTFEGADGR